MSAEVIREYPFICTDTSDLSTLGLPCEDCPVLPDDCRALAAGKLILAQQRRLGTQQERLQAMRIDSIVDNAFTPEGLRDHLLYDANLAEELRQLQWGVVEVDGRFLDYLNQFGGEFLGDRFLRQGGAHIVDLIEGLIRRRNQPVPADRRAGYTSSLDILCRRGGDEYALLVRNVSPKQLADIATRLQGHLTPQAAIERYDQGHIPFMASVSFQHASTLDPAICRQTLLSASNPWGAFEIIYRAASLHQTAIKAAQYATMWQLVRKTAESNGIRTMMKHQPDDKRSVAEAFLSLLCTRFWIDPAKFIAQSIQ